MSREIRCPAGIPIRSVLPIGDHCFLRSRDRNHCESNESSVSPSSPNPHRRRTFITNGPLVQPSTNDEIAGGEVRLALDERGHLPSLRNWIEVETNGWYTRRTLTRGLVMPVDVAHLHGATGSSFVYRGAQAIQSREDAEYGIPWIDDIAQQASEHPAGAPAGRARMCW